MNLVAMIFKIDNPIDYILTKDSEGQYISIVLTDLNKFYGLRGSEKIFEFSVNLSESVKSFALTDLKQDGSNYIVVNNGNNIEVYNLTGSIADNFRLLIRKELVL